eukprot:scaffold34667_cov302-Amphora_coffeaeformis.AAC.1
MGDCQVWYEQGPPTMTGRWDTNSENEDEGFTCTTVLDPDELKIQRLSRPGPLTLLLLLPPPRAIPFHGPRRWYTNATTNRQMCRLPDVLPITRHIDTYP